MPSFTQLFLHTVLLSAALATPIDLFSRGVVYESECSDFQDQTITPAQYDAELLSKAVLNSKLADAADFQASTAFSNYFEPSDFATVRTMFAYIAQSRTPRAKPAITFVCANSQNPGNCSSDSVLTYPDPSLDPAQKPSLPQPVTGVGFCPSFFDPDQPSAKNIYMLAPPAVCQDLTFSKLIQSGTVMVDAYASADGFGALANLPLRTPPGLNPTHGATEWVSPPTAASARSLKQAWVDFSAGRRPQPSLQRVQNAYSYAAAATEFYFLQLCQKARGDAVAPN